ncbi:MAG: DUF6691 family protein [Pseudomonadota bacterium]|nr:DUF6691 family protein [Pseudomonadota bacterium]
MNRNLAAGLSGLVFGIGLTVSQMVNPAKVLAFLDILGDWDPSLMFVMGGALLVTAGGYRLAWMRPAPLYAERFQVPTDTSIDRKLALGAVMFGAGWGLVGLCPGPAIAALTLGGPKIWVFMLAMLAGMLIHLKTPIGKWVEA